MPEHPFRKLPQVAKVIERPPLMALRGSHSPAVIANAVRAELDAARSEVHPATDDHYSLDAVAERAAARLIADRPHLRTVINATGIVLHTNLGRAPLAEMAARAAYDAGRTYTNLEFDLAGGERAHRQDAVRDGLVKLTGAESATVVNNCAAATVLTLRALAAGQEAVVSRGQLIEIGGSFRLPEIMAASGAILREVGTTNRTRIGDYEAAIGPNTGLLMRVHTSNFRVRGFTEAATINELAALGKARSIPVVDDAGSGATVPFGEEPLVSEGLRAGASLVLFSGDKLLGGPQTGIIAGEAALIRRIERDPLMRAFRTDKMTLAALEATLRLHADPARVLREVPTLRMLATPLDELRARTTAFAERLKPLMIEADVRDDVAYAGGGSNPDEAMPTAVLALASPNRNEGEFAARLRTGTPPVVARVHKGKVLLDLRCVFADQEDGLFRAIAEAL